jgi:hypothetical protein
LAQNRPTRAYTLSGLTNYAWYDLMLSAVQGETTLLTDTLQLMPTDRLIFLPGLGK